MKKVLRILLLPVLAINLVVALLLVCCAYSPLLPAEQVPLPSLAGLAFPFILMAKVLFLLFWLLIYWRYALVPLVALLLCFAQVRTFFPINIKKQTPPKNSIKVLSYNILSYNLNASNAHENNATIGYLEAADADIICLQEFHFSAIKKHKNLLKKYPYRSFDVSKATESTTRYLGCLSKHPILSVEQVDIKSHSNGCSKYRILHENDTLVVYNCHLQSNGLQNEHKSTYEQLLTNPKDHIRSKGTKDLIKKLRDSAAKRANQTDIVMDDLEQETSPYIIVCGDFNDSPISYTCQQFKKHLYDAYIFSGNGPGISYNRNKLYYRIDHIMHSPRFTAYNCTVDRSIKVSDHYPIFCFLEKE